MPVPLVRRNVAAHIGRSVLLGLVVVMATTFVVGSLGFSRHVGTVLGAAQGAADGSSLGAVAGTITVASDLGGATTPTALSGDLIPRAQAVAGVATASGTFDQPVQWDVSAEEQPDRPVQLRGLAFSAALDDTWEVIEGRAPVGIAEIAADIGGLAAGETFVGDSTDIQVPIGTLEVDVVGLARRVGSEGSTGTLVDAHALFDPAVIAGVLAAEGSFDRITVVPDGTRPTTEVVADLEAALPDGLVITELTTSVGATQHTVSTLDEGVRNATLAFAAVSMVVAVIVIANVWSVVVAQRTRELALLRLLGASRRRLFALVVAESATLGVIGAAVGAVAGAWTGRAAARVVAESDAEIPFLLDSTMIAAAVGVGLVVTVAGSLGAAARASSLPPLAALSDGWSSRRPPSWWLRILPSLAVLGGGALVVASTRLPLRAAGALAICVGVASWSRSIVGPVMRLAAAAGRSGGPVVTMSTANTRREPRRTAAAASTLIVGMTLVALIATGGASVRDTLSNQFRTSSSADFFLERRGLVRVDTDSLFAAINDRRSPLTAAAEVVSVDGVVRGPDQIVERRVVGARLDRISDVIEIGVTDGSISDPLPPSSDRGAVALSTAAADRLGVSVGDPLDLVSVSGQVAPLTVVALYSDTAVYGHVIVDRQVAASVDAEGTFELLAVAADSRVPPRMVRRDLESVARQFPRVRVHDPEEFDALNTSVADTVLRIVGVLLVGSLAMGAVGLSATIALSVIERRRELALIRVVGAQRADIATMVRIEAGLIALVGGVVGVTVGVILAAGALIAAPPEVAQRLVVPWGQLGAAIVGAGVLGIAAAFGPARRAAAASPLESLSDS